MMNGTRLDFERPILELERKVEELKKFADAEKIDLTKDIQKLEKHLEKLKIDTYQNLSPWQRIQIARHPKRPYTLDYIGEIMTDFIELHGDRLFGDDRALIGGLAKFDNQNVVVVGHQKGRDTKENVACNFGCAHPEGYRKALRLFKMAEKFHFPVISFIDTPGAYPGIGAEERGQSGAIAENLSAMSILKTPIVVVIIGEGGSGGALGIGVGDRVCILENAYYSVISPEGCAAILWKDRQKSPEAAAALKLTGKDLLQLGIVDEVIPEPLGGAHRDFQETAHNVKDAISRHLNEIKNLSLGELVKSRYQKFRKIGIINEGEVKNE
ncbi:MAG: acetyl-CoA carboxylase carboxyltransferase subunit alpha [Candidatus Omnitrophota bacterium]